MAHKLTAGERRKNPGNIKYSVNNPWDGLADPPQDTKGFCIFESEVYGIRAIAVLLKAYQDKYKLDTVSEIISRWAPVPLRDSDDHNETDAYMRFVARKLGVSVNDKINVRDYEVMRKLVEAIIAFECAGKKYPEALVTKALVLAGFDPPQQDLGASRTVRGGQVAASGAVGSAAAATLGDQLSEVSDTLAPFAAYSKWIAIGLTLLTLAGLAYMLWARYDDRRQGLR